MSETKKGVIALVILALVFATMGVFVRPLGTDFALFEQTYLRIGLAFLMSILLFWKDLSWSKLRTLPSKDWAVLIFRAITLYLGVAFFTESILHAKFGNTYFLNNLPLLPIFGYFLLRERLPLRTLAFVGLGFVGTLLIAVVDFSNFVLGYGELMALLAMLAFDFSYIARKWHSEHLSDKESTVFMFFFGTLFLFATSLALGEPLPSPSEFSPFVLLMLGLAGLFNVINLYLSNYGFGRVKVGVAGTIITLEVVFALIYGFILFNDVPLPRELIGGALIVFSVWQINRKNS